MNGRSVLVIESLSVAGFLLAWQAITAWLVPYYGTTMAIFFPTPLTIAQTLVNEFATLHIFGVIAPTLWRFALGFALSVVLGVSIGLLLGAFPRLLQAFDPLIGFFRSLPGATLIPVITLFLGLGDAAKVVLIVSAAIWPILINTIDGTRRVDPVMRETVAAFQIGRWQAIRLVLLPAAAPSIAVGMRVAVSVGLVVTIISELVGASTGIGGYLVEAQAGFMLPELWATLLLLGLLGFALNGLFALVEHRWLAWHRGSQATAE
jgi:sulfonate transport system permease protein